jgi:hypothetical protein
MLVYYLHPSLPFGLGVGHLHLMMLLHIMHSSDRLPSPPMHIDLTLLPGQLLASSKLFPCCVQYLAPPNSSNLVLATLAFSFLSVPPSWWCSPNHCPSNNNTYHRLQQCAWELLHGWWQYYWHHCSFGGGSRLYTKCCT